MYDASLHYRDVFRKDRQIVQFGVDLTRPYFLLTLHRAENTDDPARLSSIVRALNAQTSLRGIFPAHPRTLSALSGTGFNWDRIYG